MSMAEIVFHSLQYLRDADIAAIAANVIDVQNKVDQSANCATCHGTYCQTFSQNVHRNNSCEDCHGPGSRHVAEGAERKGTIRIATRRGAYYYVKAVDTSGNKSYRSVKVRGRL